MYAFLLELLHPFLLCFLAIVVVLVIMWRRRSASRRVLLLLSVPLALLYLFCTPAVSYLAQGTLEWGYPPADPGATRAPAGAIVVLSGGIYPPDATRSEAVLAPDTIYRCLHAVDLYQNPAGPCPIVVTGGKVDPADKGPALGDAMKEFLSKLGVAESDIVIERESQSTHENALFSAPLLRERGIEKIILVTEATHLPRSVRCFRKQGLEVIPSGCCYRATKFEWSLFQFLPSPDAADANQRVVHEYLGLGWYWLNGRI